MAGKGEIGHTSAIHFRSSFVSLPLQAIPRTSSCCLSVSAKIVFLLLVRPVVTVKPGVLVCMIGMLELEAGMADTEAIL